MGGLNLILARHLFGLPRTWWHNRSGRMLSCGRGSRPGWIAFGSGLAKVFRVHRWCSSNNTEEDDEDGKLDFWQRVFTSINVYSEDEEDDTHKHSAVNRFRNQRDDSVIINQDK